MTSPMKRYAAHRALMRLEWLEKHVSPRPYDKRTLRRLLDELAEIKRYLEKRVVASAP